MPNNAIFQQAFESFRESMVIVDARAKDRPIVHANPAFERMTGYSRRDVLGANCRILQGEKTERDAVERVRQALRHHACCNVRLTNYRKDGRTFHNDLRISPLLNARGKVSHFVGVQRDITEQVVTQNLLRKSSRRLAAMNGELLNLAIRDELTGLYNRRYFDARFHDLQAAAARQRLYVSVAMIDIDYFKQYNDTYGHPEGDACLIQVARCLQRTVRQGEMLARLGGEEFVIAMVHPDHGAGFHLANRVRLAIAAMKLDHRASPIGDHLTVSAGVCTAVADGREGQAGFVEAADAALYHAKAYGRDCVVLAGANPNQLRHAA